MFAKIARIASIVVVVVSFIAMVFGFVLSFESSSAMQNERLTPAGQIRMMSYVTRVEVAAMPRDVAPAVSTLGLCTYKVSDSLNSNSCNNDATWKLVLFGFIGMFVGFIGIMVVSDCELNRDIAAERAEHAKANAVVEKIVPVAVAEFVVDTFGIGMALKGSMRKDGVVSSHAVTDSTVVAIVGNYISNGHKVWIVQTTSGACFDVAVRR